MLSVLLIIFSIPTYAQINSLSQAINESGRLRMLSQRIAKTYILSQLDIQPDKAQQQFEQSSLLFKSNILQLKQFNSSINQPTINSYIENIEQISCQLPETILLCNGCVAQHYYKKAATY